jgi:uncharacterized membrane protein YeaQ/YmgE (transglycosylase-associated protein family)
MDVTPSEIIVWLIVGGLAGSFAGLVVTRKKEGFGRYTNLGIGLVGALIGGFLFDILDLGHGLGDFSISLKDLLSAFVGSLLFLTLVWLIKRRRRKKS